MGDLTLRSGGRALGLLGGADWKAVHGVAAAWASHLLVVALAGVGCTTRFAALKGMGLKPFLTGLGAALCVGLVSFLLIGLLGRFMVV